MRVLCVDPHPTAYSETYISGEMSWMRRHGVEIGFWAKGARFAPGPKVLSKTIEAFRPNVLHFSAHVHPDVAEAFVQELLLHRVPLTIRGHSFGFNVAMYRRLRAVARIWLFPHHAELVEQENVEALPVSYDPALYFPEEPSPEKYVVRAGAARPGKDIEGFLRVATLCPDITFVLIVTGSDSVYLKAVEAQAEAMGAGLPVVARAADPDSPSRFGPENYVGDAGLFYRTDEEAAKLVRQIMWWSRLTWGEARERSTARAQQFRADVVLPRILSVWKTLST